MLEDGEVRPEGGICEPCSDISPNWRDMRTKFGYKTLSEIVDKGGVLNRQKDSDEK